MAITVLFTWHCGQLGLVDATLSASVGCLSQLVPHPLLLPCDKRGGRLFFHSIKSLTSGQKKKKVKYFCLLLNVLQQIAFLYKHLEGNIGKM